MALVTFPGHYLVPFAWYLTRWPRKKLVFDAFISLHDTLVSDRKKVSPWNPYAWFLFCIDWLSYHLADEVLIDTEAHRQFFIRRFHLKPSRIRVIYLGTRDDLFTAKGTNNEKRETSQQCEVLFYGTYIPLQGIEHIIEAARILQEAHPNIHFTLIGSGQTHRSVRSLAEKYRLANVTFRDRVPYEALPGLIRSADLCLGIFGITEKAKRVIPHKVYDTVACGVPVLTADTPAIREKFRNGEEVILCKAGNPRDIAEKIVAFCYQNQES
jgi:glycosyltransferase involved in cell wall biosynthesis